MTIREIVLQVTGQWDRGIAGVANEVVSAALEIDPTLTGRQVRAELVALIDAGLVQSRWDNGAYVYWSN